MTRPDFIREAFAIFRSDFCEAGRKMLMLSSDPDLFLRDDFLSVMSFVELQTVPFHTTKVFADSPVYVVENSGALYSFIRLQTGKKMAPKETANEISKLGDYMAFQFTSCTQNQHRNLVVEKAYEELSQSIGNSIYTILRHTPVRFIFIPAKSNNLKDATIYTQTNKSGRTRVYNIAIPFSSDASQVETISATLAACIADKIAELPQADDYIKSIIDNPPINVKPKSVYAPSISFFRQVNEGETNKEAKHSLERTSKFYRAIIHDIASNDESIPQERNKLSLFLNSLSNEPAIL